MPGRNRTGPMGQGPMTGRAMGSCADDAAPGIGGFGRGMGCGMGRGRGGRGQRNRFWATGLTGMQRAAAAAPITADQQREALEAHAAELEQSLANIRARLEELGDTES